jgi:hypothetical protein
MEQGRKRLQAEGEERKEKRDGEEGEKEKD